MSDESSETFHSFLDEDGEEVVKTSPLPAGEKEEDALREEDVELFRSLYPTTPITVLRTPNFFSSLPYFPHSPFRYVHYSLYLARRARLEPHPSPKPHSLHHGLTCSPPLPTKSFLLNEWCNLPARSLTQQNPRLLLRSRRVGRTPAMMNWKNVSVAQHSSQI